MLIVVQEIAIRWSQRTRTPELSRLRNRVPDALPLPYLPALPQPAPPIVLVHHAATFSDADAFATPVQKVEVREVQPSKALRFGCVRLRAAEAGVEAVFAWTSACGAPARTTLPRRVFTLREGEWGRVVYNGRWGGEITWLYHQRTLNVGWLREPRSNPFSDRPPDRMFSELARLR